MGTAVVNDATAAYHNPAALTLLKNKQAVALGSIANYRTNFTGQSQQVATNLIQTGSSSSQQRITNHPRVAIIKFQMATRLL